MLANYFIGFIEMKQTESTLAGTEFDFQIDSVGKTFTQP